jgi:hypothetical protein
MLIHAFVYSNVMMCLKKTCTHDSPARNPYQPFTHKIIVCFDVDCTVGYQREMCSPAFARSQIYYRIYQKLKHAHYLMSSSLQKYKLPYVCTLHQS